MDVEIPATDLPADEAVSLTVRGKWAHFKRIEGTRARTYRVIPRTTATGLLAAIVGRQRDEYYDVFTPDRTRIAITLDVVGGQYKMSRIHLGTRDTPKELTSTHHTRSDSEQAVTEGMGGSLPNKTAIYGDRQRPIYHMLRDVQYTIDVTFDPDDDRAREFRDELVTHLERGTSTYTPYLGTAECIAAIDYNGNIKIEREDDDAPAIDSTLPLDAVDAAQSGRFTVEKHPYQMAKHAEGRRNDGTLPLAYTEQSHLTATHQCGHRINDRIVAFC